MEHISVISCCNPINLYITEKLVKFSKSRFDFSLFSDLCFPFPEFQVGRVTLDGTSYYIFIFDTICSLKPCQRFLKGRLLFSFTGKTPK